MKTLTAMKKYVISVGRQFGSGGHDIGKKLAERLGIKFYDKELLGSLTVRGEIFFENNWLTIW